MTTLVIYKHTVIISKSKSPLCLHSYLENETSDWISKMLDGVTITTGPTERPKMSSGTDGLPETRKQPPDQAASVEPPHSADTVPDRTPVWRRILITVALLSGVFLVALDVNILGLSIPP